MTVRRESMLVGLACMVAVLSSCVEPLPQDERRQPLMGRMTLDGEVIETDFPAMSASRFGPIRTSGCAAAYRIGAGFDGLGFEVSVTASGTRSASGMPVVLGGIDDNESRFSVLGTDTLRIDEEVIDVAFVGAQRCSFPDGGDCEEIAEARLTLEGPSYTLITAFTEPNEALIDIDSGLPPCSGHF